MEERPFPSIGEKEQFEIDLARRAQATMNQVIRVHGTGIPLEVFNPVIDTIPWESLTPAKREAIKQDLPQLIAHALKGGVPGWLTPAAVATVADLFEEGTREQIHLDRIYSNLDRNPSKIDFEAEARKYLFSGTSSQDREEVNTLIEIAKTYVGLFPEDAGQMLFTNGMRETRTENHMKRMTWFRLLMRHVFSVYATGPEIFSGRKSARPADLANLTEDFLHILREWKLANPAMTTMEMAEKRFREANLFMPVSNGDAYMDDIEGTYYLAFLFSSGAFSGDIFHAVTHNSPEWSACPIVGVDELNQPAVEAKCFRSVYFGHPDAFWSNFRDSSSLMRRCRTPRGPNWPSPWKSPLVAASIAIDRSVPTTSTRSRPSRITSRTSWSDSIRTTTRSSIRMKSSITLIRSSRRPFRKRLRRASPRISCSGDFSLIS
jgi:hypothetical protein